MLYAPVVEDGAPLGALWVASSPSPGAVNAGCTTHLDNVPARLAWLAQGLAQLTADGTVDPTEALGEVARMGGARWSLGAVEQAPTLEACRYAVGVAGTPAPAVEAEPQVEAPAPKKRTRKPAAVEAVEPASAADAPVQPQEEAP